MALVCGDSDFFISLPSKGESSTDLEAAPAAMSWVDDVSGNRVLWEVERWAEEEEDEEGPGDLGSAFQLLPGKLTIEIS